jgi:hypothetical protein
MKASFLTILMAAFFSQGAFAHGMNKAGPNGGYVRMPGNYHIELVSQDKAIIVYFLDMMFKPISIENGSVKLSLKGEKSFKTDCIKEATSFKCELKNESLNNYKEAILESTRDGKVITTSIYKLPLSLM